MRAGLFEELVESVKQMQAIRRGRRAPARRATARQLARESGVDVAALRAEFGLSQAKFAALLGISVGTLQGWEQGRRRPEGAARVLLRVAAAHPEALLSVGAERVGKRRRGSAA